MQASQQSTAKPVSTQSTTMPVTTQSTTMPVTTAQDVLLDHTPCDKLMNHGLRVSRHPSVSAASARGLLPIATRGDVINKETVCLFNPKSQACSTPFAGNQVLTQVRNVRGTTLNGQTGTFRSVERATQNKTDQRGMMNNAKCALMAKESGMLPQRGPQTAVTPAGLAQTQ